LKDDCSRCLANLKLIINSEDEIANSEFYCDSNSFSLEDYQEAIEINSDLSHLASLAYSQEVKEELFLIINRMFEDIQSQLYTGQNFRFQYKLEATQEKVELCKTKWFKKLEKISRKVYKVFKKVKEVWDFAKEVKEVFSSKDKEC
jgi:hypothetical protein